MQQNEELRLAWEFVENTGRSIFLTGKAGTGKTTFLRHVVENSSKRVIVVAPTGVAAVNAGGVTIHSFFQLPLTPYVPNTRIQAKYNFSDAKRKIIRSLDLLIIDEISMVRSDLLDAVNSVLQRFRGNGRPFGGVQLLMIGDLQQLTPVVTPEEENILNEYYETPYFFGSKALGRIDYVTIELKTIFRQQDASFIGILNNIREGKVTDSDISQLNARCNPSFVPRSDEGYIRLTTHNFRADNYNRNELAKLNSSPYVFKAEIKGSFPEYSYPTDTALELKKGAQVMFMKNDHSTAHRYYNGRIGTVVSVDDEGVKVLCPGDDREINVEPHVWENASYSINSVTKEVESKVQGTFRQLPLRLAWAITIHKSQGLTFDKVIIEADASFASGQVYVALSRCKSLDGIVLASPISPHNIFGDWRVKAYIDNQEVAAERSIRCLPMLKEEFYRAQLIELFSFGDIYKCQSRLSRLLSEYFSNQYPNLTKTHNSLTISLKTDIESVSAKWLSLMKGMSADELHGDAFLDRVRRGCDFFRKTLKNALEMPLRRCKDVKSGNKEAMKRFDNGYSDMRLAYLTKLNLFHYISEKGFSTTNYLKYKQLSVVYAMEGNEVKESAANVIADMVGAVKKAVGKTRKPKDAEKKKKEPKEKSDVISYRMFKDEGMSVEEIMKKRGFAESTIRGHITKFAVADKLPVSRLVSDDKLKIIRKAVDVVGTDQGLTPIKEICPEDIRYDEIRVVVEYIKAGLL